MKTFDFDRHFRRMERADENELASLQQELHTYLNESPEEAPERKTVWQQAIARLQERSMDELALFRQLMGKRNL